MSAALLLACTLVIGAPPAGVEPEAAAPVGDGEAAGASVAVNWKGVPDRVWAGPNLWANRLQDWRVRGGRLECVEAATNQPRRTVIHTGVRLTGPGAFGVSATLDQRMHLGRLNSAGANGGGANGGGDRQEVGTRSGVAWDSAAGLLIAAGPNLEPRAAALVHHSIGPGAGFFCGVNAVGQAFIRDLESPDDPAKERVWRSTSGGAVVPNAGPIALHVRQIDDGGPRLELTVGAGRVTNGPPYPANYRPIKVVTDVLPAERLRGSFGLVSHPGTKNPGAETGRWAFHHWKISGLAVAATPAECELGPVLGTKYTLDASRGAGAGQGLLTLQAQFWPLRWEASPTERDAMTARLELDRGDGFEPAATAPVTRPDWTAVFTLDDLDLSENTPYRVLYQLRTGLNAMDVRTFRFSGEIRGEPTDGRVLLGALSCNNNNHGGIDRGRYDFTSDRIFFPHTPIRDAVLKADPDFCFFAGDQIYEGSSPTRADISGDDPDSYLDYLYKWNLWVWAYRDVTRDRPCAVVPDDHDVFQPNLWGDSGRKAPRVTGVDGGYYLPPDWVNMVQRTQTGNLPPADRPEIPGSAVTAYYTDLTVGGVSFAVLEDRKFKTGPAGRVPETISGRADHIVEEDYDRSQFDSPDWQLLGEEQEAFVNQWAGDWSGNVWFKCVLSQSPFAAAATHHGGNRQYLVADLDANGWPKHARDAAVAAARRGLATLVHGDQHLSTLLQHGVTEHGDAGWSFAVPGTANIYPRWWDPQQVGGDGTTTPDEPGGEPTYTGPFKDGFGNKITVFAAANPGDSGQRPAILHDRRPGWGAIEFRRDGPDGEPTVTFNNYPRGVDPTAPNARQFPGWPRSAPRSAMDGRKPVATLPALSFATPGDSVVSVARTDVNPPEVLYTLRPSTSSFRPPVYARDGVYTVTVTGPDGEPDIRGELTATPNY